jgi:hypothetical protein
MISVVVPAHDEGPVIDTLLGALAPGIDAGRLDVVVVANGCSDDTARRARGHGVRVVELERGHKPSALNAGDEVLDTFPRFYVDADVTVTAAGIEDLAAHLDHNGAIAVSPALRIDTSRSSRVVRSYFKIWQQLPSIAHSLASRGCMGFSRSGRSRWASWPDVTADDQWANEQFGPNERVVCPEVESVVAAPANLRSLVERKRRSRRGGMELEDEIDREVTSNTAWLGVIRRQPRLLACVPAYVLVTVLTRLAAWSDRRAGRDDWGADRSSRER